MKLVMAVSADGYTARSDTDDMRWLGPDDKRAFKLLTIAGSGACLASLKTIRLMPPHLPGRTLHSVSRTDHSRSLVYLSKRYPDASLLGGQTLAMAAFRGGFIDQVHLCRSQREAAPVFENKEAHQDAITPYLKSTNLWAVVSKIAVGDTSVETWRKTR